MKQFTTGIACLLISAAGYCQLPETAKDVKPILIGEKVPSSTVINVEGKAVTTASIFQGKKTVLVMYRGGWCPYCSRHLAEVALIEEELINKGYQIIAISPDAPAKLKESLSEQKFKYKLFSDSKGDFAKALGIAFKAPANYQKIVKESQGENNLFLPVPSLYVINEELDIVFEYINPNFKYRVSSELIMAIVNDFDGSKKPKK